MKIIYDEQYGDVSFAQRSAYRKYNVSPVDHDMLVDKFGEDSHAAITKYVKEHSLDGYYCAPWPFC